MGCGGDTTAVAPARESYYKSSTALIQGFLLLKVQHTPEPGLALPVCCPQEHWGTREVIGSHLTNHNNLWLVRCCRTSGNYHRKSGPFSPAAELVVPSLYQSTEEKSQLKVTATQISLQEGVLKKPIF